MVGISLALCFLLGHQKNEGSRLSLSWCPRGGLGVGVGAAVGFWGRRWWGMSLSWYGLSDL